MRKWLATLIQPNSMPITALLAAVAVVLAGGYLAYYQDATYRSEQIKVVEVQGDILASGVMAALIFNDARAAQDAAVAMEANPNIEAVGVYPVNGRRLAGFVRPNEPPLPTQIKMGRPRIRSGRLILVLPVMQNGTSVGHVYLRTLMDPLSRRLTRYSGILLLVTMAALVLVVFASAQSALSRANHELKARALALAEANERLQIEMKQRSETEEALRQSQKMEAIGQLSGGIAHDFNNLLTIIRGNLQLLQRRLEQGRTDVIKYINAAVEGANRAAQLTQRILAFSRRQPLSPKPVNLAALISGMVDLLRHSVGEHVLFDLNLKSNWWVTCDANQMENVILNLVINARDAMPDGGRLTISTEDCLATGTPTDQELNEYVRLTVSDTGIGMPEEVRAKAVDPFFTTKPVGKGTGLGLSMTFGYIRQSGGQMHIESIPGRGTSIVILMPRQNFDALGAQA